MGNGTSIGRVRGLGSAQHGTHDWLLQRLTSVGNLVLIPWLLISLALLPDYDYGTVRGWMAKPLPATMLILILVNTFYHARLGIREMLGDYVHEEGNKFITMTLANLLPFAGSVFGIVSVLRIALGDA
jgi:succinate dehydrogenase / fumarate reductase membrane anchor subunit